MSLLAELCAALPDDVITPGAEIEPRYRGDWIYQAPPDAQFLALARPRTTKDVATVLQLSNARGCPVVAQGGRTGLAGGATPINGGVILSLERMRRIEAANPASATIVVEAGATLQAVQEAAAGAGLLFPLDIGGRGTCTIGGNISTNAGGNRVLRYGMMRELVLGLEVVLADGTVLTSLNTMLKNNTGYDLKQMFIGAEGTLGVVTRAVLRLFPSPTSAQTAVCAVNTYEDVLALLQRARGTVANALSAFEVMWPDFYHFGTIGSQRRAPLPQGAPFYVLIETLGVDPAQDEAQFLRLIEGALEDGLASDAVIARSEKDRQDIWGIRDSSGELLKTLGEHIGFDVSLPAARLGEFTEECDRRLRAKWSEVQSVYFGHIADSNIHICVRCGDDPQPHAEVDEIVYDCVGEFAGSISAEHGIGVLKRPYLHKSRTEDEIAVMRRLKAALDPNNILNPGKVFVT